VSLETTPDGRTVGREAELAQIDDALEGLAAGRTGCVAIEGEPGIGKTRLLAELRRRAEERGCLVLGGTAAEFERDLPFSVWADALDAYVASQELELGDDLVAELADILPSRHGSAPTSVADERYRVHRAARRLLGALSADRPLVLVLDDLQWSDDASVELLGALLRRGPGAPVLLALAFRPGRAGRRLSTALAVPGARRLVLGPLSESEATELLGGMSPRAAAAIFRHGGGNPFYLEQLARTPGDGRLAEAPGEDGRGAGVPPAVAASLDEEVASLSDAERALLEAAAVAGEPFEPDLAAAIAGLSTSEALAALDGLLALDLARPTPVPRRFAFRHPLVRRAVYGAIPGGRRLAAHALASRILAERGAAATERAHHVEQSAGRGDDEAIARLTDAGPASAPRAPAAAVHWFDAALRLLSAGDWERRIGLRLQLAGALRSLGELERCRDALLETLELLPAGDAAHRVELTARCAGLEHWLGRHEDAHRRLTRAWDDLDDRSTPAAGALLIELAVDGIYELDFDQAVTMGRSALETARATGDDVLIAAAASALCLAETVAGHVPAARERHAEAIAIVDRLPDAALAPRLESLYYLGWAENYLEDYQGAIAHVDRGIEIARATGEGRLLVPMMLVKGYTFELQGRLAEAVELCESAVEATRLSAHPHDLFWALFELAFAHYAAGDLEAAIVAGEESARIGGRLVGGTMPAGGGGPGWVLAMAHFEAGDVKRAWDMMTELGGDELTHKIPVEKCFDLEMFALVALARGNADAADEYARRTAEHAERLGLKVPAALALRARAAVLLHQGDAQEAARLAGEAAAVAASAGARWPAAFALALKGRALAAGGERSQAVGVLRDAERELDAIGSVRGRDEMRRELRKLGARAEPRGPAAAGETGVGTLTKREREIAELVTDRRTNREIAGLLFLSEKTVESHMRNIFAKLGAGSRVEVARAVERDRRDRQPA
jgi:DNA-binding CsgD family transcriptional regulator/tetratricopeptide (TPR) repeat protein